MGTFGLTLVSTHPRLGDTARNREEMLGHVARAKGDVVVFGEMALTGYVLRDRVRNLAETLDGPSVTSFQKAAEKHGKNVVFGFPRADSTRRGLVYDSAAFVTRDGAVHHYDKTFLSTFGPFEDGLWFAAGRDPGFVEVDEARFGLSICYDMFFPELHRAYALAGADVLLNISASPNTSRRFFEPLFPARAIENTCFVAYCNVAGPQEEMVYWGGSQVWGPRGDLKARGAYFEPSVLECDIDLDELAFARPHRPTIRDARPDVFARLEAAKRTPTRRAGRPRP